MGTTFNAQTGELQHTPTAAEVRPLSRKTIGKAGALAVATVIGLSQIEGHDTPQTMQQHIVEQNGGVSVDHFQGEVVGPVQGNTMQIPEVPHEPQEKS